MGKVTSGAASLAAAAILMSASTASALTADEVLLVANQRSAISLRIAQAYRQARRIPPQQVFEISTEPQEEIDRTTFTRDIERPIGEYLVSRRLVDRVLAIVLTKDVPLKIRGTPGLRGTQASVDSELTLLYRSLVQGPANLEGWVANPYFASGQPSPFTRAGYDIYLVTRLDGYTLEDVLGLIERATHPAKRGKVVLERKRVFPWNRGSAANAWLDDTKDRLKDSGLEIVTATSGSAKGTDNVIGYAGWGSNDPAAKTRTPGVKWLPGAIASWFVSTSARTFSPPPPGWHNGAWSDPKSYYAGSPQSLVGDLIAEGVTGTVGFVYEPYLDATARPNILFPAYRAGFTLAESLYMALPYLSWQSVVVGDPLLAPFGPIGDRPPPVSGISLFLQRRARTIELVASRTSTRELKRALTVAYAELALEWSEQHRMADALALAARAVDITPDEPEALYALGAVHELRGEQQQAAAAFRKLIELDPTSPYAQRAAQELRR